MEKKLRFFLFIIGAFLNFQQVYAEVNKGDSSSLCFNENNHKTSNLQLKRTALDFKVSAKKIRLECNHIPIE